MRLWELIEGITPAEIEQIERELDQTTYMPADQVAKQKPVLDLELPSGRQHFMQRIIQRADKAKITPQEIEQLLLRARTDPKMHLVKKLDDISRETDPSDEIVIQDPKSKLTIPVTFNANPDCVRSSDGSAVCLTRTGKEPKNQMVAKTIFRKGVEDDPEVKQADAARKGVQGRMPQRPVVVQRQGFRR